MAAVASDNLLPDEAAEEALERLEATWVRNVHLGIEAGREQLRLAAIRMLRDQGMDAAASAVGSVEVERYLTREEVEWNR